MKKFEIEIVGTMPILMHSSRLSNPLDPATKAMKKVSAKKSKTDDDHEELARLEHQGSLYFDEDLGPFIPGENIWRALYDAGKKHKFGVKIKEGLLIQSPVNPLAYEGPRTIDGLWKDKNFVHQASVKVGMARVIRTRPIFNNWAVSAEGLLDPNVLDFENLEQIVETAGNVIGLGDWRPRFGRFEAKVKVI